MRLNLSIPELYLLLLFFFPQVFYYLGELNDSLSYALGAGPLFDVSEDSDYVHTLLGKNDMHVALILSGSYYTYYRVLKLCMCYNFNYL